MFNQSQILTFDVCLLQIPFESEMFRIVRTGPSNEGDPVFFFCKLPTRSQIRNNKCVFTTPNGTTLHTDLKKGSGVYDEGDKLVSGLSAMSTGTNKNICGLMFKSISYEYFGNWNCIFNEDLDYIPEHRGDFTLLTKEEPDVEDRLLPRHVVPEHYDLQLVDAGNFTIAGSVKMTFRVVADNSTDEVKDFWVKKN